MKKIVRLVIGILIAAPLALWAGALAKTEYLTYRYGAVFAEEWKQCTMVEDVERCKVLEYSEDSARVYYVEKDRMAGQEFIFVRVDDDWKMTRWNTIWAKQGSADEFIWPYFR